MVILAQAGITFYLPSFVSIKSSFQGQNHQVALTLTSYMAGYALWMLFWGWLADFLGRKKALLLSISMFSFCSLLLAITHSLFLFVLLRFFQGAAGGGCAIVGRASLRDLFEGPELAKAMSYVSMAFVLGSGVFQFIGGQVEKFLVWRDDFWIMGFLGLIAFILVIFLFEETKEKSVANSPNVKNYSLLKNYLEILKNKKFMFTALGGGICYGITISFNTIAPFLIQIQLKVSPEVYGYLGLFISSFYLAGSIAASRLVAKVGVKNIINLGFFVIISAGFSMLICNAVGILNLYTIIIPILFSAFGQAMIYPGAMTLALKNYKNKAGYATALFGFVQQILGSGSSFISSFLSHKTTIPLAIIVIVIGVLGFSFVRQAEE